VLALVIDENSNFAFIRQSYINTCSYIGIAGYPNPEEPYEEAVKREVLEETGLAVNHVQYIGSYYHEKRDMIMLGFAAQVSHGEFKISKEVDAAKWFAPHEAESALGQGTIIHKLYKDYVNRKISLPEGTALDKTVPSHASVFPKQREAPLKYSLNKEKFENDSVIGVPSTDENGNVYDKTLIGSYVIIPKSHVPTPFDLSAKEWHDTKTMLDTLKKQLDEKYNPDGYNIGWNVGHIAGQTAPYAHLHIIPRYKDEPFAGKGIRHWLKKPENTRP